MSNLNYIEDYLNRMVAIEVEAVAALYPTLPEMQSVDALPYAFGSSSRFPYWLNRVISYRAKTDSQDYRTYRYRMGAMYVRGMLTAGVPPQPETNLYTDLASLSDFISGRNQLQSVKYPTVMQWLDPEGVYISDATVLIGQVSSGIGAQVIGAEIILDVPITVPITQAY